jgi:phosphate transport system permease protein
MTAPRASIDWQSPATQRRLAARYRSDAAMKWLGLGALAVTGAFLGYLLFTIVRDGWTGFQRTEVRISVDFDAAAVGRGAYEAVMAKAAQQLGTQTEVVSAGAWVVLRDMVASDPGVVGTRRTLWVPVRSQIDLIAKGKFDLARDAATRGASDAEVADYRLLQAGGLLRTGFNLALLTANDSTDAELAGVGGAIVGSLLTLLVAMGVAFPIGVLAAIWLEEFAPHNRWTDMVEVSINNLAAVPSIIFGLLGLAFFLNVVGLPRSAPLVGGLTLALMTLPVIVISARLAVRAVGVSVREAALGIGASPMQLVFQHVLPQALPGIMTGSIIGMARALGETAPLLLIGMRAFIVDTPAGLTSPATALPVQIFLWSDTAQRGFVEKTSAAIIVLLVILALLSSIAVWLRQRYEAAR